MYYVDWVCGRNPEVKTVKKLSDSGTFKLPKNKIQTSEFKILHFARNQTKNLFAGLTF